MSHIGNNRNFHDDVVCVAVVGPAVGPVVVSVVAGGTNVAAAKQADTGNKNYNNTLDCKGVEVELELEMSNFDLG